MLPGSLTFSTEALESLVQQAGYEQPHLVLRGEPLYRNERERAELHRRVSDELSRLPIYERPGVLDREFAVSLRCICQPEIAFVAITHVQQRMRYLFAGSFGREGVLGIQENDRVVLQQADPDKLPEALVAALPNHQAAKFRPFSVPYENEQQQSEDGVLRGLKSGARSRERQLWDELVAHEQYGGGQIAIELRDAVGRRRESDEAFAFYDMDLGRWGREHEQRGSYNYVFCAPLSTGEFATKLRRMQERLTG